MNDLTYPQKCDTIVTVDIETRLNKRLFDMTKTSKSGAKAPVDYKIVQSETRTCFGIAYFASEEDAALYERECVKAKGLTYNGGWFDGMACGRERTWDKEVDGRKLFAVTN